MHTPLIITSFLDAVKVKQQMQIKQSFSVILISFQVVSIFFEFAFEKNENQILKIQFWVNRRRKKLAICVAAVAYYGDATKPNLSTTKINNLGE